MNDKIIPFNAVFGLLGALFTKRRIALLAVLGIIASAAALLAAATVVKPYTFSSGQVINADEVNENFDVLYQKINELAANIQPAPVGAIVAFAGPVDMVPAGWLLCDGRLLESTDPEYEALYQTIGTYWGSSGTRFRVPDLRGEFLRGADNGRGLDPDAGQRRNYDGVVVGDIVGSFQDDAFQGHGHRLYFGHGLFDGNKYADRFILGTNLTSSANVKEAVADGMSGNPRVSAETRSKNAAVNFIIKYK